MWRLTVNRAPSRLAAVHRVIAAGFFCRWCHCSCSSRVILWCQPVHTFNHMGQAASSHVICKKVEFPVTFSVVHTACGYQDLWCVNSCSHTAFLHRMSDVDGLSQTILPFTLCGWGNHVCSHLRGFFLFSKQHHAFRMNLKLPPIAYAFCCFFPCVGTVWSLMRLRFGKVPVRCTEYFSKSDPEK